MKSTILQQTLFGIILILWGRSCDATTTTDYIATHTFTVAEGKGFFDQSLLQKFSPPHAKDIKVAGVNVVDAKVVCQYNNNEGTLFTTYRATISGKTVTEIENAMAASSYFDQFNLTASNNFKPVVVEAPEFPLVELSTKTCSGSTSDTTKANKAKNEKLENYVFNGFVDKPDNFPESAWKAYLEQCYTKGNPMLPSFEPQVVSPAVIGIIYGVGLG